MDTSYRAYLFYQTECKVSDNISYTTEPGYCAFAYDDYHQNAGIIRMGSQIDTMVLPESATSPCSDVWLVEVKDFRVITKPPRVANSSGLHITLQRKFADSHTWLLSQNSPREIRELYQGAQNVHFCAHIELPDKNNAPTEIFQLLISVYRGLVERRMSITTPNNTALQIMNAELINKNPQWPWNCQV